MMFAWQVCKYVKSNAIVFARERRDGRNRRGTDEPGLQHPHRGDEGSR